MFGYLITDPLYYKDATFNITLLNSIRTYSPKFACFRDKRGVLNKEVLRSFPKNCNSFGIISVINGSLENAIKFGFSGVHLTSLEYSLIKNIKSEGLTCIASCHSRNDAIFCIDSGVDYVTISPVFASPNKSKPLGVDKFKHTINGIENYVVALGGIVNSERINDIASCGVAGFASIRYFVND